MANFRCSQLVSGICLIFALTTEVSSLVWKLKPGSDGNLGSYGDFYGGQGMRGDYGQWNVPQGWGSGWNEAWVNPGNQAGSKGTTFRSCYDSRQCWPGECCRSTGYGVGRCGPVIYGSTYGCLQPRPTDGWQKPIYPQKPGIWEPPRNIEQLYSCSFLYFCKITILREIQERPDKLQKRIAEEKDRPGFCPPYMQWKGSAKYCRQDQDCPSFQKCCLVHGKPVCVNPVFT